MERVLISEFKARCIQLIKRVQATRQPLIVTLRGHPMAKVIPFEQEGETGVKSVHESAMRFSKTTLFISISVMNGRRIDDPAAGHPCLVVGS